MNKPLAYIIDLDGTLYDNSHRQHLIPADRSNTAGWVEFNCACTDDVLREDMSDLVRSVLLSGREVIFLTGRGEAAGEQTMQRLLKDFNFIEQPTLIMRPMDCHTSSAEFKRDAVQRIRDSERWAGYDLIALEDDPSIVEVMRGMGVTVLHIDSKCCTVEKPHHNGMMQLSNELADLKRRYAELQEVVGQRNGECDRLINEQQNLVMLVKVLSRSLKKYNHTSDLVKRAIDYLTSNGMMNATDCLRGGLLSAHDQTDTAPAQFESLAGEPVSEPYKLPDVVFHMVQAEEVFIALRDKKVSDRVKNPELGAMGATNIQVWTSKTGGELHFESSNGGCTLTIKSQGVKS